MSETDCSALNDDNVVSTGFDREYTIDAVFLSLSFSVTDSRKTSCKTDGNPLKPTEQKKRDEDMVNKKIK